MNGVTWNIKNTIINHYNVIIIYYKQMTKQKLGILYKIIKSSSKIFWNDNYCTFFAFFSAVAVVALHLSLAYLILEKSVGIFWNIGTGNIYSSSEFQCSSKFLKY